MALKKIIFYIVLIIVLINCNNQPTMPKPHGYPRIYYPEKKYIIFDTNAPYSFEYPTYAKIINHSNTDAQWKPYWYNIFYKDFNATLHLSYREFNNRNQFDSLYDDTKKLAYKHTIKADEIEEFEIKNPETKTTGIIYNLKGNTASNLNFYISDSKKHFLRGALYFNTKTEIDSISPAFEFLKQDALHLIKTIKWKN